MFFKENEKEVEVKEEIDGLLLAPVLDLNQAPVFFIFEDQPDCSTVKFTYSSDLI